MAKRSLGHVLESQFTLLFSWVIVAWVAEAIDQFVLADALDGYGIRPLSAPGLIGIPLSPFLHAGFPHLASNTVPFVVLGWLILSSGKSGEFFGATTTIILIGGALVWLLGGLTGGPNDVHIGASGVVFGFLGYLLAKGWFERSVRATMIAILVGVLYGGLIFGVFPGQPGVSWQAHLFGFIAGGLSAWSQTRPASRRRR